jgi:signal transduction histidine kinase
MIRRLMESLPACVARVPATVHKKLLTAFLAIAVLLITVGAIGLLVLGDSHHRAEDLVQLQRKIAAYRQLQQDTTGQLYSVASAMLVPDERSLDATIRQLNQLTYNLDRLHFVAKDEVEVLRQVRKDFDQFIYVVSQAVELIGAGKVVEGDRLQMARAHPLAERLDRVMNELVNRAEVEMVDKIAASNAAYIHSRWIVIGFAVGSIALALILGYAFSWSLIGPVEAMDSRLKQIAAGDFSQRVEIINRDELGTLAANLNRMNDELGRLYHQLDDANRHKSQFLANVNHDLRTPVCAIISYAGLTLSDPEGHMSRLQRENLQDLLKNAERLLALIDSLLDIAKIEAGKMDIRVEPIDLADVVQLAISTIESSSQKNRVRVSSEIAPDLPVLNSDREKLKQILFNLLENAIKFTEQGEIKILASRQNGSLKLAVSDTGIGIPDEDLDRIFVAFYRGRPSIAKKFRGTGLGLSIVKKLVDFLGGNIEVSSEINVGSTFTVVLPLDYKGSPSQPREIGPV